MFMVEDGDLVSGGVGLYCWANDNVQFSQVRVYREDLAFNNWLIDETFEKLVNNRWIFIDYHAEEKQTKLGWRVSGGELQYVGKDKVAADGQDTTKKLETLRVGW